MTERAERRLPELRTESADPSERGRAAGAQLADRIALVADSYLPIFERLGFGHDRVLAFGDEVLTRVDRFRPALAEELVALAAGARQRPELIAALNGRTELLALDECTAVACLESDDGPWLAQNWDWYGDEPERCVVWQTAVEGASYTTMTEAGVLAKVGVSSRGLAVSLNILHHRRDGTGPLGVPVHIVLREVLASCATVADVADLLADVELSASSAITVVDAGCNGACFELSPAGVRRIDPIDGLVVHANHFLSPDLAAGELQQDFPLLEGSNARVDLVAEAAPRAIEHVIELLRDHGSTPQAICRHDEQPTEPGNPLVDTVASLVMRPAVPALLVAAGQPCCHEYLDYAV